MDKYISFFPNQISHILKTWRGVNFYLKKYLGNFWIFFFWQRCGLNVMLGVVHFGVI